MEALAKLRENADFLRYLAKGHPSAQRAQALGAQTVAGFEEMLPEVQRQRRAMPILRLIRRVGGEGAAEDAANAVILALSLMVAASLVSVLLWCGGIVPLWVLLSISLMWAGMTLLFVVVPWGVLLVLGDVNMLPHHIRDLEAAARQEAAHYIAESQAFPIAFEAHRGLQEQLVATLEALTGEEAMVRGEWTRCYEAFHGLATDVRLSARDRTFQQSQLKKALERLTRRHRAIMKDRDAAKSSLQASYADHQALKAAETVTRSLPPGLDDEARGVRELIDRLDAVAELAVQRGV